MTERGHGQLYRQLFLGERLDRDHINAIYHDAVLAITIPVAEQGRAPCRLLASSGRPRYQGTMLMPA
jgi:HSP20 family protein